MDETPSCDSKTCTIRQVLPRTYAALCEITSEGSLDASFEMFE